MLGRGTYTRAHVDACRAKTAADLAAYQALPASTPELEQAFFSNAVLALEQMFVHRLRGKEGKDGNAANEVRLLALGLTENGGLLPADSQIKLKPETSVLGIATGERIRVTEAGFAELAEAYFAQVEKRFVTD
jgi:hypothetical protein